MESMAVGTMDVRDLLRKGIIEYVDCNEENNTLIAVTERDLELAIQQGLENRKMRYIYIWKLIRLILGVIGGVIPVS
jgi:DNA-directed RNA polymerase III subunit RPC2